MVVVNAGGPSQSVARNRYILAEVLSKDFQPCHVLRLGVRMRESCVPKRSRQSLRVRLGRFAKQLVLIALVSGSGWVEDIHEKTYQKAEEGK